jgi:predicted nucleic acid-binding protein
MIIDSLALDWSTEKRAKMSHKGITLHSEDLFIGATAAVLGLSLAAENK